jgi:hypothetical protein
LSFGKRPRSLRRIVGDGHWVSVSTSTPEHKTRVIVTPNVRAKRATTAGRQAREVQNMPQRLAGLVACRWRSA